jgi:hypothetical protein
VYLQLCFFHTNKPPLSPLTNRIQPDIDTAIHLTFDTPVFTATRVGLELIGNMVSITTVFTQKNN